MIQIFKNISFLLITSSASLIFILPKKITEQLLKKNLIPFPRTIHEHIFARKIGTLLIDIPSFNLFMLLENENVVFACNRVFRLRFDCARCSLKRLPSSTCILTEILAGLSCTGSKIINVSTAKEQSKHNNT